MRFFIGALALAVICAVFGSPAVLLMGWRPLTVSDRQIISSKIKSGAPAVSDRKTAQ